MKNNTPNRPITLCAVGDIMAGEDIHKLDRGVRSRWLGRNLADALGHLRPYLTADLCIGNFECVAGAVTSDYPRNRAYIGDPAILPVLKSLGFTHLSVANNHILDQGYDRAVETAASIEAAGITLCNGETPVRTTIRNHSIDLFSINLIHDTPNPHRFYADQVDDRLLSAIQRSDAAIKIAAIHWGHEYSHYPSREQIDTAYRLIDAGITCVLGHHPHVLQGVHRYKGGLIIFSLGNFIFDHTWSRATSTSAILTITIHPHTIDYDRTVVKIDRDYIPRPIATPRWIVEFDRDALRYRDNIAGYRRYLRRRQMTSRLLSFIDLLKDTVVSPLGTIRTWKHIAFKRILKKRSTT